MFLQTWFHLYTHEHVVISKWQAGNGMITGSIAALLIRQPLVERLSPWSRQQSLLPLSFLLTQCRHQQFRHGIPNLTAMMSVGGAA